jgi:predicted TIM-barrel fold metal-dependent hydrolase
LDRAVKFGATGQQIGGPLPELPSKVSREHLTVSPYFEDDIKDLVELIGVNRVLFGSDFPHPEGMKNPLNFLRHLEGFPITIIRRIMRDNAAESLGLDGFGLSI